MNKYESFRRHQLAIPFELVMLVAAVVTLVQGNWKYLAISLFTLTISFAPLYTERRFRVKIPALLQVIYVAFIFASMFSGEVLGMYGRIWPWDDAMHFVSGLLIGLAVMFWLVLSVRRQKRFYVSVWFEALTIFCISATIAVVWEVVEFASDQIFGTFSQGKDLEDTMMDLVYGLVGGLIMGTAWVFHLKNKKVFITSWMISHFEQLNTGESTPKR